MSLLHRSLSTLAPCLTLATLLLCGPAWAARPLSSEDAGTAPERTCQVESWLERAGGERAWVVAPACGLTAELEVDLAYALPDSQVLVRAQAELATKWVPAALHVETAAGTLDFGSKATLALERPADSSWRGVELGLWGLATFKPSESWALHANLGAAHDRRSNANAALLNLALVWTPNDHWLVFAEALGNSRHDVFGANLRSAGVRHWLVKDKLALDLSALRATGEPTLWTAGNGWYGLGF